MNAVFEQPAWLWWLAAAPVFAIVAGANFLNMSGLRRWTSVLLRVCLLGLLAALLAGLHLTRTTNKVAVVAVLDLSESTRGYFSSGRAPTWDGTSPDNPASFARAFLRRAIPKRGPEDLLGVVVFDGSALAVAAPSAGPLGDIRPVGPGTAGTNIADALRLAQSVIPADAAGRIVLFSDGNQTSGDALRAIKDSRGTDTQARARRGTVRIDVVPLSFALTSEVVAEGLDAPPVAPAASTINLRLTLRATGASTGTVRLLREGKPVDLSTSAQGDGLRVELAPGINTIMLEVPLAGGRVHRFEAVYEPDNQADALSGDTIVQNNAAKAFTITPGQGSVLVVDGVSDGSPNGAGRTLSRALERAGLDVTTAAPQAFPDDLLSLENFDLIILQNVGIDELPLEAHDRLGLFVRELGGGLVMSGGPDSFAAGGWRNTKIADMLPVLVDPPDRVIAPEVATVFVIDNSGSMNRYILGSTKSQQTIANEATALAILSLDANDLVGVIEFNSQASVVVPLTKNDRPKEIAEEVRNIGTGGGTNVPAGLERALEMLAGVTAKQKQIVLLTDGKSMHEHRLPELAEQAAGASIRLNTIAVGDDADRKMLAEIASIGKGTYFDADNPNALPRIFLKAVRVVRTPAIREAPFVPRIINDASPVTLGLGTPPALGGLNLTQRRNDPTVATAMVSPKGEPVLASWPVGLGTVVAFTSDAHAWAASWIDWPGYERLWAQIVRAASRPIGNAGVQSTASIRDGVVRLRLEAARDSGEPWSGLRVPATVFAPSGSTTQVLLEQTAPGVYEAKSPAGESGSYVAVIKPAGATVGRERFAASITGATSQENPELRFLSSNDALLAQLAGAGGGKLLDPAEPTATRLFDRATVQPSVALVTLWKPLMVALLVVLLLDVACRRVAWDRFVSEEFREKTEARAQALSDRIARAAPESIGGLRRNAESRGSAIGHADALGLSTQDAQTLARAARDQRRARRLAQATPAQTPAQPPTVPPDEKPGPSQPRQDEPGGLLAAKRRAAKRFDE